MAPEAATQGSTRPLCWLQQSRQSDEGEKAEEITEGCEEA
jgi:hypothetical protein